MKQILWRSLVLIHLLTILVAVGGRLCGLLVYQKVLTDFRQSQHHSQRKYHQAKDPLEIILLFFDIDYRIWVDKISISVISFSHNKS